MKKTLLGASALVGVASFVAAPALAAEAPEISFSGALGYEAVWSDGDQEAAGTGLNITGNEQQSELVWAATGTADNGLEYGANVQWRWLNNGSGAGAFDESYMDFRGGFGRVYLGSEDGVSDLVAGTAGHTVQVGAWGTDGNNALRSFTVPGGMNTTLHYYQSHAGMTSDANKIGYVTPSFGGFQAGISYTPDGNSGQAAGTNNGAAQKVTEIAAGYNGTFGDVSLTVDGSYGFGKDEAGGAGGAFAVNSSTGAVTQGAITGDQEDIAAYQVGAMVGFAGFNVAGAWGDNDDSGCAKTVNNCDAGDYWNLGAGYSFGPVGVSVMYQEAQADPNGNGRDDESEIFHAGVAYTVAEGLSTYANYYNMDFSADGGLTAANKNEADVLILGSRITF
jgi:outer membrane protein OmpU